MEWVVLRLISLGFTAWKFYNRFIKGSDFKMQWNLQKAFNLLEVLLQRVTLLEAAAKPILDASGVNTTKTFATVEEVTSAAQVVAEFADKAFSAATPGPVVEATPGPLTVKHASDNSVRTQTNLDVESFR